MSDGQRPSLGRRPRIGDDGDPEVFVSDEQSAVPVDPARWAALAAAVLREEGVRGNAELSLAFVDEDEIAALNAEFLGGRGPTDVLAFPLDAAELLTAPPRDSAARGPGRPSPTDDEPLLLGDVVVCPSVAARNAPTHAGSLDDELALLVVHGVLHVLGHDHREAADTAAMQARELALLEAHHWHGPAPAGFSLVHTDHAGSDDAGGEGGDGLR